MRNLDLNWPCRDETSPLCPIFMPFHRKKYSKKVNKENADSDLVLCPVEVNNLYLYSDFLKYIHTTKML